MAKKISAYVDTSALIAFLDHSDSYHPLFRERFSDPPRLVTTALVIAEGHGWFLKRYDIGRALQFLTFVESLSTVLRILAVGETEIKEATRLLRQYSDQDLSLADTVGLWAIKHHRLHCCWSTDHHFRLSGLPLIIDE